MLCSHRPLVLDLPRQQKNSNFQVLGDFFYLKKREFCLPWYTQNVHWMRRIVCLYFASVIKDRILNSHKVCSLQSTCFMARVPPLVSHSLAGRVIRNPGTEAASYTTAHCKRCAFQLQTRICPRGIQHKFLSLPNLLSMRKEVDPRKS